MKRLLPLFLGVLLFCSPGLRAQSHPDPSRWDSPNHDYSIVITDAKDSKSDNQYQLAILHRGKELAHYSFDDGKEPTKEVFWSPGENYVAFNDHYGHRAWRVWIISLKDGSLIRKDGLHRNSDFDIYGDYEGLPDVLELAKSEIAAVYPGYAKDTDKGGGHITVIYGWENESTLRMFDEMVYDHLANKENICLSIYSLLKVEPTGLSASHFTVNKTPLVTYAGRPKKVAEIIGL